MIKHFVIGVYPDAGKAKEVIHRLIDGGISKGSISLVARSNEGEIEKTEIEKVDSDVKLWGTQGAIWGGLIGALMGGAFFIVPGFGPIVGVGPVSAALAGLLGGAMTGGAVLGLADALVEWGMSEHRAKRYEKLVEENKVLVIVHGSEEEVAKAEKILEESGAEKVERE